MAMVAGAIVGGTTPASAQSVCPPSQNTTQQEVIDMIGGDYADFGFSQSPTTLNLSIGQFANAYSMSSGFVNGTASGTGQIAATSAWLAPVSQSGTIIETVSFVPEGSSCVVDGIGDGAELGTAISQLGSGDVLFSEWPQNAWYKLNGTTVTGLTATALALHPNPISLTNFQTAVVARYPDDYDPDLSGGVGDVPQSNDVALRDRSSETLLLGGAVILLVLAAINQRRRRLVSN